MRKLSLTQVQDIREAETKFMEQWPGYQGTASLDNLRAAEFGRLDRLGQIYLDYTGSGLYADCQIREHAAMLRDSLYANPHSHNPTSENATRSVEHCRGAILDFFNASPEEYVAIFTPNASGALKLVGESFPFDANSCYLLTYDNHNSVNGIREFARIHGGCVSYVPMTGPELRIQDHELALRLTNISCRGKRLFAYPAQSNFSGVQHSLDWVAKAQAAGWTVLLDAAAFVPTNRLDLSCVHPDFISLSFYKMFGYPTGVGCLLARRDALQMLRRPWFAGGTITVASVQGDRFFLHEGAWAFEDGTVNFLSIPAVEIGLRFLRRAGVDRIHERCRCLAGWLQQELMALRHDNGRPALQLYGPATTEGRGGTVTFNLLDGNGSIVDHRRVEETAAQHHISLRTGCFCNPGDGEVALGISRSELKQCFARLGVEASAHFTQEDLRLCISGKGTGAVRVSFGIASNFADAWQFLRFAASMVT